MRAASIKKYLKASKIAGRWTTFNGSFQAALAVPESYDAVKHARALKLLGQDPDAELTCVYCDEPAATWDHLENNVRGGRYSGYGHRIFNLVPACRSCNESKSGKSWAEFVDGDPTRRARLEAFAAADAHERFGWERIVQDLPELAQRYLQIQEDVRSKVREADEVAAEIRARIVQLLEGELRGRLPLRDCSGSNNESS